MAGGIERKIEFSVEEASARTGSAGGSSSEAVGAVSGMTGGWGRDLERDGVGGGGVVEDEEVGREVRDRRGV